LAASGAEGLALARAHLPDLIVLDVVMPGENGFDLLKEIKAEPAIRDVPVIIFTLLSAQYREKAERLGAVAYIPKPFDMRDIVQTIRKFL
jgi:CheY-like chemotaxis protein